MPNIKSAKKRLRQSQRRRLDNRKARSEIRTRTKLLLQLDSKSEAEAAYRELAAVLDRAAQRRLMHPNRAARQKSRLSRYVSSL
ncbi:MAG: 30S ribosomal protein S20 [Gemmatimonadota bacterium]